ncbi:hypothetical protein EMCG_01337 [[Emmonsia] crescens]|uniref:Uncharacterized protein n=1 Tax=[Emmonsia] crescens TaxID=73230 RepID=A0A0G2I392_9EURO|nr:hypothetical protein EMCG_01337 [Emmonsia crescens UAMH 3008]
MVKGTLSPAPNAPVQTLVQMPTPNANGTITMTTTNLLAFCQHIVMAIRQNPLSNNNNNGGSSANDLRQEVCEYQKEVRASLDTKAVTIFNGFNYQAWKVGILADAKVISGTDRLQAFQAEKEVAQWGWTRI